MESNKRWQGDYEWDEKGVDTTCVLFQGTCVFINQAAHNTW
jgi:hypothetical protein